MRQKNPLVTSPGRYIARMFILCIFFNSALWAQQAQFNNTDTPLDLKQAFELAWDRQPEAKSATLRRNVSTPTNFVCFLTKYFVPQLTGNSHRFSGIRL